jgi:hypothetical protein
VSDINIAKLDSLIVHDPRLPIREADMAQGLSDMSSPALGGLEHLRFVAMESFALRPAALARPQHSYDFTVWTFNAGDPRSALDGARRIAFGKEFPAGFMRPYECGLSPLNEKR